MAQSSFSSTSSTFTTILSVRVWNHIPQWFTRAGTGFSRRGRKNHDRPGCHRGGFVLVDGPETVSNREIRSGIDGFLDAEWGLRSGISRVWGQ